MTCSGGTPGSSTVTVPIIPQSRLGMTGILERHALDQSAGPLDGPRREMKRRLALVPRAYRNQYRLHGFVPSAWCRRKGASFAAATPRSLESLEKHVPVQMLERLAGLVEQVQQFRRERQPDPRTRPLEHVALGLDHERRIGSPRSMWRNVSPPSRSTTRTSPVSAAVSAGARSTCSGLIPNSAPVPAGTSLLTGTTILETSP